MNNPGDLLSTAEAAALLRRTPGTLRRWQREGRLAPAGRLPGGWLWRRGDVLAVLEADRVDDAAAALAAQVEASFRRARMRVRRGGTGEGQRGALG